MLVKLSLWTATSTDKCVLWHHHFWCCRYNLLTNKKAKSCWIASGYEYAGNSFYTTNHRNKPQATCEKIYFCDAIIYLLVLCSIGNYNSWSVIQSWVVSWQFKSIMSHNHGNVTKSTNMLSNATHLTKIIQVWLETQLGRCVLKLYI